MSANVSMHDLNKLVGHLGNGEIVLDVRSPEEYADGHIAGAKNIPHDQVVSHADELKKYKKIYVHCMRGGRAGMAFEALKAKGLTNLVCISSGGMADWMSAGYPTKRGAQP